jgi:iron-sulfur cluster assembly accessory protein
MIIIKCTPAALSHIQKQLARQRDARALRIHLKKTGCSGWSYQFSYGVSPHEDEISISIIGNMRILIQKCYQDFFNGVIIDYVRSGLNGVLTCVNPNEGARCGCGESFVADIN